MTDFGAEYRGAAMERRQRRKRDGRSPAERAVAKQQVKLLRRQAGTGNVLAALALQAGGRPRGSRY
jgi:hypothetical protein